jgi:hypothetical protein
MRLSDIPDFTSSMTESTGEAGFGAGLGAALVALAGARFGAGVCPDASVANRAMDMSEISFNAVLLPSAPGGSEPGACYGPAATTQEATCERTGHCTVACFLTV